MYELLYVSIVLMGVYCFKLFLFYEIKYSIIHYLFKISLKIQRNVIRIVYFYSDPNDGVPSTPTSHKSGPESTDIPYWDSYDTINQLYLELGKFDYNF